MVSFPVLPRLTRSLSHLGKVWGTAPRQWAQVETLHSETFGGRASSKKNVCAAENSSIFRLVWLFTGVAKKRRLGRFTLVQVILQQHQSSQSVEFPLSRSSAGSCFTPTSERSAPTQPRSFSVRVFPARWPQPAPIFPPCKIVLLEILQHRCVEKNKGNIWHIWEPGAGLSALCLQVHLRNDSASWAGEWKPCCKLRPARSYCAHVWQAKILFDHGSRFMSLHVGERPMLFSRCCVAGPETMSKCYIHIDVFVLWSSSGKLFLRVWPMYIHS